jgi:hypothetical protein
VFAADFLIKPMADELSEAILNHDFKETLKNETLTTLPCYADSIVCFGGYVIGCFRR